MHSASRTPLATRPDVAFPGRELMIAGIDEAVSLGDEHAVTASLRTLLCRTIGDPAVRLPACVHAPIADHYARRELYRSPVHGYSVVAMTWGPGQGTPIHDHCGLWCVEGVWDGQLEITQYQLVETAGERFRFRAAGGIHAGPGSAGSLIPPHEYHTI
ncbi:MAG TPA: cysteine dioxygenase family protein, partial [Luteimonas sp.]|nr:cysteine dioxygenase family protein [Luteimonas sp.]